MEMSRDAYSTNYLLPTRIFWVPPRMLAKLITHTRVGTDGFLAE